ncbi:hypothetical protein F7725_029207 [Dissostichus mawsoni]|uniref:AN1-type domain-containing protein n=1 Tax=Dissostichus mawsoni TaxID=36200 RepID=A0A7J5XJ82_DISMA|nr:hypothetical protein F7725_029207 [Dissostichus mawsoni]
MYFFPLSFYRSTLIQQVAVLRLSPTAIKPPKKRERCLLHQLFYTRFVLMAELNIGKHCRIDSCHQNDFLPFVCDLCRGSFCLDHRSREAHSCSEEPVKKEPRTTGGNKSYPCSFQDCRGKELLPVVCPHHRHQDDHECEKLEVQKPRMAATKELVQKIVDGEDVFPGLSSKGLQSLEPAVFFCSKWSVGKAVDYAASLASLKNSNNILKAKKLRLCHPQTGEALQMDDTLLALLSHQKRPSLTGETWCWSTWRTRAPAWMCPTTSARKYLTVKVPVFTVKVSRVHVRVHRTARFLQNDRTFCRRTTARSPAERPHVLQKNDRTFSCRTNRTFSCRTTAQRPHVLQENDRTFAGERPHVLLQNDRTFSCRTTPQVLQKNDRTSLLQNNRNVLLHNDRTFCRRTTARSPAEQPHVLLQNNHTFCRRTTAFSCRTTARSAGERPHVLQENDRTFSCRTTARSPAERPHVLQKNDRTFSCRTTARSPAERPHVLQENEPHVLLQNNRTFSCRTTTRLQENDRTFSCRTTARSAGERPAQKPQFSCRTTTRSRFLQNNHTFTFSAEQPHVHVLLQTTTRSRSPAEQPQFTTTTRSPAEQPHVLLQNKHMHRVVDSQHRLFLFVGERRHHVVVKQDVRFLLLSCSPPLAMHALPVLLQVPAAVEPGAAELAAVRPLPVWMMTWRCSCERHFLSFPQMWQTKDCAGLSPLAWTTSRWRFRCPRRRKLRLQKSHPYGR